MTGWRRQRVYYASELVFYGLMVDSLMDGALVDWACFSLEML